MGVEQRLIRIAHAVLEAKDYDARRTAAGLMTVIATLMNDDAIGRRIIAQMARELADELEEENQSVVLTFRVGLRCQQYRSTAIAR
jgi:hypothetical protein